MDLLAIATRLQTDGFGTLGQTLFYESMPSAVDRCLLVTAQMPVKRDEYISDLRSGSFQVISRQLDDDDYQDPSAILETVITAISGQGITIGPMNFRFIRAQSDPFVFPKSEGDIVEASVNFDFLFTC